MPTYLRDTRNKTVKMCRLVAYLGQPVPISEVVIDPEHSLLEQSQHASEAKIAVQGDGFGFAWYDGSSGPGLYREVLPAWSDGNLLSLCRMIRSNLFLAHVRASTTGETSRMNCHPFAYDKHTFMHNGQVPNIDGIRRPLEALLPDDLYLARRGTTDSELIFLLLLANGLKDHPVEAVSRVIEILREQYANAGKVENAIRLTCVISDGVSLHCFRYSGDNKAPTLYAAQSKADGWIVASEPLDATTNDWSPVEPSVFVTLSPAGMKHSALKL